MPEAYSSLSRWGPAAWVYLHVITFHYPPSHPSEDEPEKMRAYVWSFAHSLPCEKCRTHFLSLLKRELREADFDSRDALSRRFVELHNLVNVRLGKATVPYDRAKRWYLHAAPAAGFPFSMDSEAYVTILVVLVLVSAVLFLRNGRAAAAKHREGGRR